MYECLASHTTDNLVRPIWSYDWNFIPVTVTSGDILLLESAPRWPKSADQLDPFAKGPTTATRFPFRLVFLLVAHDVKLTTGRPEIPGYLLADPVVQIPLAVVLQLEMEIQVSDETVETLVFRLDEAVKTLLPDLKTFLNL
jgi:hypothetical protein